jgi:GntR family transcriptional regulator
LAIQEYFSIHTMKQYGRNMAAPASAESHESKWKFEPLDKASFTPMYVQIQNRLLALIQAGDLRPGDSLPSEEQLSRVFGVSRMTSRQALQTLKNQGLASRNKGQGTFVNQPRVEKDIAHLCGFTIEMRSLGMKAASRVLKSGIIPAPDEIAARLSIEVSDPIFRLRRLRLADGLPLAIEEIHLPGGRFPGIERLNFAELSLYKTIRERYGVRFSRVDEILEARSANKQEAELLDIKPRSSLLIISRTLWSVEGTAVETAHSIYRGDRYRAVVRIPAMQ